MIRTLILGAALIGAVVGFAIGARAAWRGTRVNNAAAVLLGCSTMVIATAAGAVIWASVTAFPLDAAS